MTHDRNASALECGGPEVSVAPPGYWLSAFIDGEILMGGTSKDHNEIGSTRHYRYTLTRYLLRGQADCLEIDKLSIRHEVFWGQFWMRVEAQESAK